mgnify:CR=1 FL=1
MNRLTQTILYAMILAIMAVFLFNGRVALAAPDQNDKATSTQLTLTSGTSDFSELDIESRKQILINVLEFSKNEVSSLKDGLLNLKLDNDTWQQIRDEFLNKLSSFSDYYQGAEDKINSTSSPLTIDDVKSLASALKDWRENTYSPELDKIINMLLIFGTDNLLKTTQSRFDKISSDVKKLDKQHFVKTDALKNYLSQADKHLKNMKRSIDGAKKIFLKSIINSDAKNTSDKDVVKSADIKTQENSQDTIRKMAKDSLKELKITYEIFFSMNNNMKSGQ